MSSAGPPAGDGTYPVHKNYWGYDLLTDSPNKFMSSFIPQFNYFLSRGYQQNEFYSTMSVIWLAADMKYWSLALGGGKHNLGNSSSGTGLGSWSWSCPVRVLSGENR